MRSNSGRISVEKVESRKPVLHFPPFRLDLVSGQLRRGAEVLPLRAKSFAVLQYLVEHAGQLVTKDTLLEAVWPDTVVTEALVKDSIFELRKTLSDEAKAPHFIETVHRRGYRFIARVARSQYSGVSRKTVVIDQSSVVGPLPAPLLQSQLATGNWPLTLPLVGRETELAQLHKWLAKAVNGERQVVFVTGEPGIGKTTLIDAFLQSLESSVRSLASKRQSTFPFPVPTPDPRPQTLDTCLWLGRGQCIEQYGAGEAYMPVLEAFGRLCRGPGGEHLIALLHQHAPTWLAQMPTLLPASELEALQRKVQGSTRERMLREIGEALDVITAEQLLVLWLEDLHWSDVSTLDLLAVLARRHEPARLLVLATYRPGDVLTREHPLRAVKQELQLHELCQELLLGALSEKHVADYLEARFTTGVRAQHPSPHELAHAIHERTEGNPLFMVNVVNDAVLQGSLVQVEGQWILQGTVEKVAAGVPETLRQMIERQLAQLNPQDQRMLEVASVAGLSFSAAALAVGTGTNILTIERQCTELARRGQFLRTVGTAEWPDGTVATRYEFLHTLYREVMYGRLTASRSVELHRRIGGRAERAYGDHTREIAAELAVHFAQGREYRKAVQYLTQAGQNAVQRSAHREAITLLTKGLELLKLLPDTPERAQQELPLQVTLALPLMFTKGLAAPEVGAIHTRALELCQQVDETPQLFPALWGAQIFYLTRAELQTARELAERLISLAQRAQDPALLAAAHYWVGSVSQALGELASARIHFEQAIVFSGPRRRRSFIACYGADLGVGALSFLANILWLLGYPDQARKRSREALSLAEEIDYPWNTALIWLLSTVLYQFLRETEAVRQYSEALNALSNSQGFSSFWTGTIRRGWALTMLGREEEGIQQIRQGIASVRATGMELYQPYNLALLAEAYGKTGQVEEGLTALAEALAVTNNTGERWHEAELYRLKGELMLQQSKGGLKPASDKSQTSPKSKVQSPKSNILTPKSQILNPTSYAEVEAEECFLKAIKVARRQSAKSLELRAAVGRARLWQRQGKWEEAHRMLAELYNWFTEGFDTKDLQGARALLEELKH